MKKWIKDMSIVIIIDFICIFIARLIIHFRPDWNESIMWICGIIAATIYLPIISRKDYEKEV